MKPANNKLTFACRIVSMRLIVGCALFAFPAMTFAVEDVPASNPLRSEELPPPLHAPGAAPQIHDTDNLESQIRRLITEVKESRDRVRESEDLVPPPSSLDAPTTTVDETEVFDEIDQSIKQWDDRRDQRIQTIQEKVQLLNRLLAAKKLAAQIQAAEEQAQPAAANDADSQPANAEGDMVDPSEEAAAVASASPKPITDSAVDQLSLADNLFGAEKIQLALGAYQSVDQSKLSDNEKAWVTYQFGVCHRRLGNIADAQKNFRIVAGLNAADGLPLFARWQLDAMGRKTDLIQRIENVKSVIESAQAQLQTISENKE